MPVPHYVAEYEGHVAELKGRLPLDEAMESAVGGDYVAIGRNERAILEYAGLREGMSVVDIGCGSGRLASALSDLDIDYVGTDVVQDLLDYAAQKSRPSFRFLRHTKLTVPCGDASVDIACAFSVFTHLRHEESYLYSSDIIRALRPGGVFVFSFLEFAEPQHWAIFQSTVANCTTGSVQNTFIERPVIRLWVKKIGFEMLEFIDGMAAPWNGGPMGQAVAILRKPA